MYKQAFFKTLNDSLESEGIAIRKSYVVKQALINKFVGLLDGLPDGSKTAIYSDPYEMWRPQWTD